MTSRSSVRTRRPPKRSRPTWPAAGEDGSVSAAAPNDPIADEVVVLAVYYPDARTAVEQHADQLAGKVVVDITNPVNENVDGLVVPPDGSATDQLAKLAPGATFVKAFNTTFAGTLVDGEVSGSRSTSTSRATTRQPRRRSRQLVRDGKASTPIDVAVERACARTRSARPPSHGSAGSARHELRQRRQAVS